MQEDWLKDIHNKMADYEADEPCGLWNDICGARQLEEPLKQTNRSKVVVWLWTRRIAAVAAMVTLVFSVGYFTTEDDELPPLALTTTDVLLTGTGELVHSKNPSDAPAESAESAHFRTAEKKLLAEAAPDAAEAMADTLSMAEKNLPETKEQSSEAVHETTHPYKQKHHDKRNERKHVNNNYIAQASLGKNKSGRLSCGIFMTGGASSAFYQNSAKTVNDVGIGPDGANWKDSPLLGILLYNEGKEVETDIKYRLPVRTGISFAYKINNRFSLGSGVTYTNLTSDMREGSDSHYFTGEQTLHYIGIPLNMRYNIVSWKGLELYASSGLLAEKCVSGKLKKKYILNNQVEKKETQNLDEKPLQWSVNASAGLQYNITRSIGLYAEPGVSYYFKDGTSLKTIYKDKPLNFNFNIGLRFAFGNK